MRDMAQLVAAAVLQPRQEHGFASSTVAKVGIRSTRRAWIVYRDAWTAFAQARYPAVPAAACKTWPTERRTTSLREWLEGCAAVSATPMSRTAA